MPLFTVRMNTENKLSLCRATHFSVLSDYTRDETAREKYFGKQGFIKIFKLLKIWEISEMIHFICV